MQTMYLIILTLLGGLFALFVAAGWGSYNEKKLPAIPVLFRWFIAGLLTSGLGAYTWLFGAGGDPTKFIEKLGDALEVKDVMENLTSAIGGGTLEPVVENVTELTVGMPSF